MTHRQTLNPKINGRGTEVEYDRRRALLLALAVRFGHWTCQITDGEKREGSTTDETYCTAVRRRPDRRRSERPGEGTPTPLQPPKSLPRPAADTGGPCIPQAILPEGIVSIHDPSVEVHRVESAITTGTSVIVIAGGG